MGRSDGSWEQRLRRLARFDLLILDDFALRPFTTSQGDDFYELVSERAGRGSFILTANRSPKDWYELFPNAVVAEGVLDRLVNSSFHVHMEGNSYRPRRRPGQTPRLAKGGATEWKKRTRPGGKLVGARSGESRGVRHVGGIPTLIRNGVNGMMFSLRTPAEDCARWIAELHSDRIRYAALVRTSFEEYQERLNWRISGATVMRYLTTLCGFGQDA